MRELVVVYIVVVYVGVLVEISFFYFFVLYLRRLSVYDSCFRRRNEIKFFGGFIIIAMFK